MTKFHPQPLFFPYPGSGPWQIIYNYIVLILYFTLLLFYALQQGYAYKGHLTLSSSSVHRMLQVRHAVRYWVWPSRPHHDWWWSVIRHAEGGVAPRGHGSEIRRVVSPWWNCVRRGACRLGGSNRSRYHCAGRYRSRSTGLLENGGGKVTLFKIMHTMFNANSLQREWLGPVVEN